MSPKSDGWISILDNDWPTKCKITYEFEGVDYNSLKDINDNGILDGLASAKQWKSVK